MSSIACPHCDHRPFRTENGLAWHLEHIHGVQATEQESSDELSLRLQLAAYGVAHLHYMIPIGNCQSIVNNGILPFNHTRRIQHIDLAARSVQRRRNKTIPGTDFTIHDFVPLYFATHTPMQRVWTQGSRRESRRLNQEDLVFIDLDAFQVLRIPGIIYTDGNAASDTTQLYEPPPFDLSKINWDVIREPNCWSREMKRRKAAEVLVPECVPLNLFSRLVVYDNDVAEKLESVTDVTERGLEIVVDPSYY